MYDHAWRLSVLQRSSNDKSYPTVAEHDCVRTNKLEIDMPLLLVTLPLNSLVAL